MDQPIYRAILLDSSFTISQYEIDPRGLKFFEGTEAAEVEG